MSTASEWSREEEKAFENAIATHWVEDSTEHWDKIASLVPSKSMEELKQHYEILVEDIRAIEEGKIQIPNYTAEETTLDSRDNNQGTPSAGTADKKSSCGFSGLGHDSSGHGGKGGGSRLDQERKKGIPWTEEEHRLFLLGLDKFGKGDWRSISRNFVISRTPTQVASHAQKYFIRLNSMNRDRRRSSIHDITSVNNGDVAAPQPPITGQQSNTNPTSPALAGPHLKHRNQPLMSGIGMYGAPMGHPVSAPGHMASAVGTPVMLPPGHHAHHPPYALPMAYPMPPLPPPPPPMHQ
ncbi:hypothetical protein SAY87_026453 [Trapa incisa]|uniref:Uncharacterized protein n=1 Tax=Trapa incisa TaxID=236973 RepID=A0AAN7JL26_9MYRT|nr:hypothetical protein SAY87_026453 [Trapa incisa]